MTAFIVTSFSFFNILSNEHFTKFLHLLNNSYKAPSRQTLTQTMIPAYVTKAKTIIQNEINSVDGISLTIDGWTSNYTSKKYLSLTSHYIYENKLKSVVLKLAEFKNVNSSENISDYIKESKNQWNLNRFRDILIMTDNAPDMLSGVTLSGNSCLGCI